MTVDQGVKTHSDGLRKQVLCGVDGLAIHVIPTDHAWKPHARSIVNENTVQL